MVCVIRQVTMADRLRALGYHTGLIGKWHLGNRDEYYPTRRGFDYFYGLREGSRGYFYNPKKEDQAGHRKAIEENGQQVEFDGYLTDVLGQKAIEFVDSAPDKPFFSVPVIYRAARTDARDGRGQATVRID